MELTLFAPPDGRPGYALVVERREIELRAGANTVRFEDVPRTIDAATVTFRSFTDPEGTTVAAQGQAFVAASPRTILDAHAGREVVVVTDDGETRGTLVGADGGGIVLATAGRARIVPVDDRLRAIRLAAGEPIALAPALVWRVTARRAGRHLVEVTYVAARVEWRADHRVVVHAGPSPTADVTTLVTITNDSGRVFADATVDLVALAPEAAPLPGAPASRAPPPASVRLPGRLTLPVGERRQVVFGAPERGLLARRLVRFDPAARLPLQTDRIGDVGYGARLAGVVTDDLVLPASRARPAGQVAVFVQTGDDEPVLVAETRLEATTAEEPLRLEIGRSAQVTASRRRLSYRGSPRNRTFTETFEIVLHNEGGTPVDAVVVERMYRTPTWEITDESRPHVARGARIVEFPLSIPARDRARLSYTVEYHY